jgi:hypothetical protein
MLIPRTWSRVLAYRYSSNSNLEWIAGWDCMLDVLPAALSPPGVGAVRGLPGRYASCLESSSRPTAPPSFGPARRSRRPNPRGAPAGCSALRLLTRHGPERCPAPWRHPPRRRSFRRNCTITPRPSVRGGDDGPWDLVWPAAPEYRSDTGDGQRTIPRRGGGSESLSRLQVGERRGRCACGGWSGGGSAGRCAHCTRPSCLVRSDRMSARRLGSGQGLEDVLRHVRASPPGSDRPGRYCDGARRRGERGGPRRWPRPP